MNDKSLITVIAVCYNHERWLWNTLEGIRNQAYPNIQLIICDDCSKDNSVALINKWKNETGYPCHSIFHTKNQGLCKTLNEALSFAQGQYLAVIATDDIWLENHLEDRIKRFDEADDNVAVVYGDASLIDEENAPLKELFSRQHKENKTFGESTFDILLANNFICAPTVVIRRSSLLSVGLYDENLCYEDWDMWLRLSKRYRFVCSPEITTQYRIVNNSLTRASKQLPLIHSNFLIFSKYLKDSSLTSQQKEHVKNTLYACTKRLYAGGYHKATPLLWKHLRLSFNYKTLCLFLISLAIPGKYLKSVQNILRNKAKA